MPHKKVLNFPDQKPLLSADQLRCIRIPGRPAFDAQVTELHNDAYRFWRRFWADVFMQVGETEKPSVDDFVRQDLWTLVKHQDSIAALHGYAFFDLKAQANRDHSFFGRAFNSESMRAMDTQGVRRVMTWEFFSVAPEWQGKSHGFSLGTVLLSLGIKAFLESGADMLLGVGRVDVGAAKMAYALGGAPLGPTIQLHGIPTDLVGILKSSAKITERPAERGIVETIWAKRLDFTRAPFDKKPSDRKRAA